MPCCRAGTTPQEFEGLVQRNLAASCSFSFLDLTALLHTAVQLALEAADAALDASCCKLGCPKDLQGHRQAVAAAAQEGQQQSCACVQHLLQALLCQKRAGLVMRGLSHDMAAWAEYECEGATRASANVLQCTCTGPLETFVQGVEVCRRDLVSIETQLAVAGEQL